MSSGERHPHVPRASHHLGAAVTTGRRSISHPALRRGIRPIWSLSCSTAKVSVARKSRAYHYVAIYRSRTPSQRVQTIFEPCSELESLGITSQPSGGEINWGRVQRRVPIPARTRFGSRIWSRIGSVPGRGQLPRTLRTLR